MRINKYIAAAGIASRRKADELIKSGKVKINGEVLKEPGYDVTDSDTVEVLGQLISGIPKSVYYALNKPAGYVSTLSDEKGRPTVVELLTDVTVRVFPVGRLDYDTSGLLLLTNDGKLAERMAHPKNKVWKTYMARINGILTKDQILKLRNGVVIEVNKKPYKTAPARVTQLSCSAHESVLEIKISEGKNRQIRKMVEAVGFRVLELERTAIGDIRLGRTKPGSYRKLSAAELDYLKNY
jgi:23S rRNA pseudouridine2605 synthase